MKIPMHAPGIATEPGRENIVSGLKQDYYKLTQNSSKIPNLNNLLLLYKIPISCYRTKATE
jgi:hypothetical protein